MPTPNAPKDNDMPTSIDPSQPPKSADEMAEETPTQVELLADAKSPSEVTQPSDSERLVDRQNTAANL